jgi:hypothetical protein
MTGKKLLALMIVPLFAVGMVACGTDEPADDEIWTEEAQIPAYEAEEPVLEEPMMDEVEDDTVMVPDEDEEEDIDVEDEGTY